MEFMEDYLLNPQDLYESEGTTAINRSTLYGIEEFFVRLKFGETGESNPDENALSEIVDSLMHHEMPDFDKRDYRAAQDVVFALNSMRGEMLPVPESLRRIVKRDVTQLVPSLIVRLSAEGMRLIKSSFRGIAILPDAAPALRGGVGTRTAPMHLAEEIGDLRIEYRIHPESGGKITLETVIKDKIGSCRVTLKKEGRMVASTTMEALDDSVDFSGIEQGIYEVEIVGAVNHSFRLYLVYE